MKLEVRWEDKPPKYKARIDIKHHIKGKDAKLMCCMIEMQLAEGIKDIIIDAYDNKGGRYSPIIYHMTRKQAMEVHKLLDGVRYNDEITFVSYGTYWE